MGSIFQGVESMGLSMRNYILACVLICLVVGSTAHAEIRTWRARKGKFTTEAELVDVKNGSVVLKKKDDTTITVPLDQLSLADVKYVDEYLRKATEAIGKTSGKKKPAKKSSSKNKDDEKAEEPSAKDDPAEMESATDDEEPSEDSSKAADSEEPSDEMDESEADDPTDQEEGSPEEGAAEDEGTPAKKKRREPPLTRLDSTAWQVRIDVDGEMKWRDISIDLPDHTSMDELVIPATPSSFVAAKDRIPSTGIHSWNLRSKKRFGPVKIDTIVAERNIALSPDGDLLAVAAIIKPLQIWSLKDKKLVKEIKLGDKDAGNNVHFMVFSAPNRLLVSHSFGGVLTVLDPRTGAEFTKIETKQNTLDRKRLAISPCGTYIAVGGWNGPIRIFDIRNGALAGEVTLDKESRSYEDIYFSPDGEELTAVLRNPFGIACWSTKNGKLIESHDLKDRGLEFSAIRAYTKLDFVAGKKGWIIDGRAIVDRPKGRLIWKGKDEGPGSNVPQFIRMLDSDRMLVLGGDYQHRRIYTEPLPWAEIEKSTEIVEKGGTASDVGMPPVKVAGTGGKKLKHSQDAHPWKVPRDAFKNPELKVTHFDLPKNASKWLPPMIAAKGTRAVVSSYEPNKPGAIGTNRPSFHQINLATGAVEGLIRPDFECKAFDVSPDGTHLAVGSTKNEDRVDIYEFEAGKHVVGFRPHQGDNDYKSRLWWAAFIDSEHLLTSSYSSQLTLWSIPECKPIYTIEGILASKPILSPNRKYLIDSSAQQYQVIDVMTGQVIGTLIAPKWEQDLQFSGFDFSDDGAKLAAIFKNPQRSTLVCWNMGTGKMESSYDLGIGDEPSWLDEGRILIQARPRLDAGFRPGVPQPDRAAILDLTSSRVLWRYQLHSGEFALQRAGGLIWYTCATTGNEELRLVGRKLPDGKAKEMIAETIDLPELLPAGTAVTLEVNVKIETLADRVLQDALRTKFADALTKRKLKVEERTALALHVFVRALPDRTFDLRTGAGTPVQMRGRDMECRLALFDVSRKHLWGRTHVISLRPIIPAEAIKIGVPDALAMRELQWADAEKWIVEEGLPEKVHEPWVYNGMGESVLETSGETVVTIDVPMKK